MAKRAQSSIPTIAERLAQPSILNPAIRSYSYSEYDEKRPGYVAWNQRAGTDMGALARALSGFYTSFSRKTDQVIDAKIEEEVARGQNIYLNEWDTEELLRNRVAWKDFIEKNPEHANESPWVKRGYEMARLKELGIEFSSGMVKTLDEQGAFNNEDPRVLQSAVNTYAASFRLNAGLDDYADKLLLAQYFSPLEAQARTSVTNTYDNIQKNSRQDRLAEQTSSLLATTIMDRVEKGDALDYEQLGSLLKESLDNGLLNAKADDVLLAALQTAYLQTKSRSVLDAVKYIEVDGTRLIDLPEGAQWYTSCIDSINREEMARARASASRAESFKSSSLSLSLAVLPGLEKGQFRDFGEAITWIEDQTGKALNQEERYTLANAIRDV